MKEELIKLGFIMYPPNINYPINFWMLYPLKLKEENGYFLDIDTGIKLESIEDCKTLFKLITKQELK